MAAIGHALLVALPERELAAREALERMASRLSEFGFSDIVRLPSEPSSALRRVDVYAAIDSLIARVGSNDPCVFYYFGHGGRVRFTDLPGRDLEHVFGYLRCSKPSGEFEALLDVALSARLGQLASACGNLTTILDACHSAVVMRTAAIRRAHRSLAAPAWVHEDLRECKDRWLARESNPSVVRLAGSTPLSEAQTTPVHAGRLGVLTEHLCDELRAIRSERGSPTWDALIHRIRGRIFAATETEHQWVVLAGPRERRIFTTDTLPLPRTVGLVPSSPNAGWIWAGKLQGVEVGDRWVSSESADAHEVEAVVTEVDLNRARLTYVAERPLAPGSARLARVAAPMTVELDDDAHAHAHLGAALARSAWLEPTTHDGAARVVLDHDIVVSDPRQRWLSSRWPFDEQGVRSVVELLDDQARSRCLLGLRLPPGRSPQPRIRVRWGRIGEQEAPERLRSNQAIWIRIDSEATTSDSWFVQVIYIDGLGRPWQLAPSQPDGIEVRAGEPQWIGLRPGRAQTGVSLGWPPPAEASEAPGTLLVLSCGRPLQLGHLVRPHVADDQVLAEGLALRPEQTGLRGAAPAVTTRGEICRFDFTLERG